MQDGRPLYMLRILSELANLHQINCLIFSSFTCKHVNTNRKLMTSEISGVQFLSF